MSTSLVKKSSTSMLRRPRNILAQPTSVSAFYLRSLSLARTDSLCALINATKGEMPQKEECQAKWTSSLCSMGLWKRFELVKKGVHRGGGYVLTQRTSPPLSEHLSGLLRVQSTHALSPSPFVLQHPVRGPHGWRTVAARSRVVSAQRAKLGRQPAHSPRDSPALFLPRASSNHNACD